MNHFLSTILLLELSAIMFFTNNSNMDRVTLFLDRTFTLLGHMPWAQFGAVLIIGLVVVGMILLVPTRKEMATKYIQTPSEYSKAQRIIDSYRPK